MKTFALFAICLFIISVNTSAQRADSADYRYSARGSKPSKGVAAALNMLEINTGKLDKYYINKLRGRERDDARALLTEMSHSIEYLRSTMLEPVREAGIRPADFKDMLKSLRDQHFDSDKKRFIEMISRSARPSVTQTIEILNEFMMSQDKIDALRILYPAIDDKENAYKLVSAFTYSSEKEKVMDIIEGRP